MKLNLTPEVKPVILGGTGVSEVKAVNTKEVKPMLIWEVIKGGSQLNHSEITFIRKMLCRELEEVEGYIFSSKITINTWWDRSDPNLKDSAKYFDRLNYSKDNLRRLKKRKKTIESSLYKLKKMMKDVV